tara:strand:- start:34 stop:531 length:498 start_codon:yes stop_codon:yes gene_type:complete
MNRDKILLVIGCVLLFIGINKPEFKWPSIPTPSVVDTITIDEPKDSDLKKLAEDVRDCFLTSNSSTRSSDALILANLYKDIARLISLEKTEEIVTSTETIRQVNVLCGSMLDLDIRGKYYGLGEAAEKLVTSTIGQENVKMTEELRAKSVDCFNALAWACSEGSK